MSTWALAGLVIISYVIGGTPFFFLYIDQTEYVLINLVLFYDSWWTCKSVVFLFKRIFFCAAYFNCLLECLRFVFTFLSGFFFFLFIFFWKDILSFIVLTNSFIRICCSWYKKKGKKEKEKLENQQRGFFGCLSNKSVKADLL